MPRRPLSGLLASPATLDLFEPPDDPGGTLQDSGDPALLPPVVVDPTGLSGPCRPPPDAPGTGPLVVWGWHILRALDAAGTLEVYVDEREVDPREALLVALALEGRRGDYRWEEMRRIVDYCRKHGVDPTDEVSRAVTGDSGLLPRVERYRGLSPVLRAAVEARALDLKSAERLSGLPEDLLARLLEVSEPVSHSNRKKVFTLVRELVRGRLMELQAIEEKIEQLRDDPVELLRTLRRRRYPELSSMEERIELFNREHLGGSGVSLKAPANFEGRNFSVSFSFSNPEEFGSRLSTLRRAEDHLEDILDLL